MYIENTFDIKFIRLDQKQRRNGEACRASPTCFSSSLINLISKYTIMVFYLSCIISRFDGEKTTKQMKNRRNFVRTCWRLECANHLTNRNVAITVNVSISQSSSEIASGGVA